MKKSTLLGVIFALAVLGYLIASSFRRQPFRCQVCITFEGRRNCATSASQSEADAQRSATTTACATISSGVIESSKCENTPPDSIQWLARQ